MPDVIILDIVMPQMDGYEVIAALKKSVSTRKIPVVFVTGLSSSQDEKKGLAMGGADYISKPFNDEVVKLRVNNQIRLINYIKTIERMSRIDQLTGMHNRRSFDERLFSEWKRAKRENNEISILIMDIDHFKRCNDTYGHLDGDVVIQKVADAIRDTLMRSADFSARWGGEEFIALLPNTDSAGAFFIAEKIRKDVEDMEINFSNGESTKVTLSIGMCTMTPDADTSVDDLLRHADSALYFAKNGGRNMVWVAKKGDVRLSKQREEEAAQETVMQDAAKQEDAKPAKKKRGRPAKKRNTKQEDEPSLPEQAQQ
jgi:diguanylate cyclase (GGDEF)-like protein